MARPQGLGAAKHAGGPRATKLCPALSFSCDTACRGELRAKNCLLVLVRAEAPWATQLCPALSCEAACRGELCTTNCPLARLCELRRPGAGRSIQVARGPRSFALRSLFLATRLAGQASCQKLPVSAVVRAEAPWATQLVRAEAHLLVGCGEFVGGSDPRNVDGPARRAAKSQGSR